MRSITLLSSPLAVQQFLGSLWRTPHFQAGHRTPGHMLHTLAQQLARYPLILYDMSVHPLPDLPVRNFTEAKHFSPWWRAILRYEFQHDALHDTCWLHDLAHCANITYAPHATPQAFRQKMAQSERHATIVSNYAIYLDFPELRQQIPVALVVDRFLEDATFMQRWQRQRADAWQEIAQFIEHTASSPTHTDPALRQIRLYHELNEAWFNIWEPHYTEVETAMATLTHSIDSGQPWEAACTAWLGWLTSHSQNPHTIPFLAQAEAFRDHYLLHYPQAS